MSGQSVYKVGIVISADASGVKPGVAATREELASIGPAAAAAQTKMQQLIATATGLHTGSANNNQRAWTGALAAEGLALDNLRAKYNPLFAVIQQYKAAQVEIRTAHAMGALSADEMTAAMQRQRQAALASIDAIKGRNAALVQGNGMGGHNFAATNAMFQLQDIGMTAAMGMNPGMIALQQGSQLAGNFAGMGLKQAGSTMLSAVTQLFSMTSLASLAFTGLTAAAIQYFMTSKEEAKKLDDVLGEHDEYLKRLSKSYDALTASAKRYGTESIIELQALGRNDLRSLRAANKTESRSFFDEIGTVTQGRVWGGGGDLNVDRQFLPFSDALKQLRREAKAGVPDFDAFFTAIDKIAKADPQYEEQADELAKLVQQYRSANEALREQEQILRQIQARQRGNLIGSQGEQDRLSYLDDQRLSIDRMQAEADARRASSLARSPAKKGAAARQQAGIDKSGSADEYNKRVEIAGTEAYAEAEKQLADAKRDRARSISETLDSQKLELSLIGKTISETEALRMQYQLTADLKAEAAKNGVAVDQDELRLIEEKARAYGVLAEQIAATNMIRDQQDQAQTLQAELSLVGAGEAARRKALAVLQAEQDLKRQGIASESSLGNLYKRNAELLAQGTLALEKQTDAWNRYRSAGESAIDTIFDGLGNLDSPKDILKNLAGGVGNFALDMAKNSAKNALLGTNYGTLSDLLTGGNKQGGVLSSLLGSTGMMTLNAGTVMLNGGVSGGLGGIMGALTGSGTVANDNGASITGSISKFAKAIQSIESGGNYNALGPVTRTGDRAYGAYQVMGANIPGWTQQALGQSLSPQQFLSSSSAQDAVFNKIFGGYVSKYGASGAAQAWFGGPGSVGGSGNGTDILGTSGNEYVSRFNSALGKLGDSAGSATSGLGALNSGINTSATGLNNLGSGLNQFGQQLGSAASGSTGSGGGLFSGIGNWFSGLFGGGVSPLSSAWAPNTTFSAFLGLADGGGPIVGPGGPRDDVIPIMASAGEFMVNAAATAKHLPLLKAINSGQPLGKFANGGAIGVTPLPSFAIAANSNAAPASSAAALPSIIVNVDNPRGDRDIEDAIDRGVARGIKNYRKNLGADIERIKRRPKVRGQLK